MATIKGGSKLEARLKEIAKNIQKAATLQVGFLENASYPDGTSVAMVAAAQEFGTSTIPSRPFFRNMIADKSGEWPDAIAKNLKANNYDAAATLKLAGEGIKGQLQESIQKLDTPPLAPATVKRKGFDKPLIETSHMINSVDYEVTE